MNENATILFMLKFGEPWAESRPDLRRFMCFQNGCSNLSLSPNSHPPPKKYQSCGSQRLACVAQQWRSAIRRLLEAALEGK